MLNINSTEQEQDKLIANTCHRRILQQSEVQPVRERCNPRKILNALLTGPIQIVIGNFLQLFGECEKLCSKEVNSCMQHFLRIKTFNFESNFQDLSEMHFVRIPIIFL